ncbi:hypothetical protein CPA58_29800 [Klebsiella pneumoniae]|nr:hypothetical protein CPA58_29795 [Klebsiella pneumoniae]PCF97782.1 hypothetical protein CPA58_29800 [Klebsiella pneumoniae]
MNVKIEHEIHHQGR